MLRKHVRLLMAVGFAGLLCGTSQASAQTAPSLGASQSFAVLGGSGVTVAGAASTVISGDVGSSPTSGAAVSGFPPGSVGPGFTLYTTNATVVQDAQAANTAAYNSLASSVTNPCGGVVIAADELGGKVLGPNVYCLGAADLTGTLTLTTPGIYVFKASSSLTTAGASNIVLGAGVSSCDIYWQVTSTATLGAASTFRGNIFALTSINLGTTANVTGRTWASTGAVTMDGGNTVGGCSTVPAASVTAPTLGKAFSPFTIAPASNSVLTITLSNPNTTVATLTSALTDTLPTGVVIAATPNAATTCGGSGALSATAGGSAITLAAGRTIAAGSGSLPGTCTVTVTVTAPSGGVFVNNIPAGALQTSNGNNALAALTTLTVVAGTVPTLGKGFSPSTIVAGAAVSTLTITLGNANAAAETITAALIDTLPTGMVIAATPNASTTCAGSGAVGATAGGSTVTLQPTGRIPGATGTTPGTCTVTVDVTAAAVGNYLNTLPANALVTSGGSNNVPVTSTLTVVAALAPAPVPTLSEWAMITLATLLGLTGILAIRRRRAL